MARQNKKPPPPNLITNKFDVIYLNFNFETRPNVPCNVCCQICSNIINIFNDSL